MNKGKQRLFSLEEATIEANRCLKCSRPLCVSGCPINNDIPLFIDALSKHDLQKAYDTIRRKSCLSLICSTVCPHEKQCEGHCVQNKLGKPIRIGQLESFISDYANKNNLDNNTKKPCNGKKVLAIGSGPASLSFAYQMALEGYLVTVIEKENYIGGVLKWGIPYYRLDSNVLDNYIDKLNNLGVTFIFNTEINDYQSCLKGYDYVFIGIGVNKDNHMHINGEYNTRVYSASCFLKETNLSSDHQFSDCGKNVIVVGGGNVAMDVARNAKRLKQVESVTIVYRRTINEMPACQEELLAAQKEGIKFMPLTNPVSFINENGKLAKVECAIMELGEEDSSGRRRPIESNKPHIYLPADTVVLALGFYNDSITGVDTDEHGHIIVDENNMTNIDKIYAGGDAVTGAKTVVMAMKAGLNAANSIIKKENN